MPPSGSGRTDGRSRRSLLKAGAGTLASAAAAASAGCIATLPPLGQRIRYGRVDVPETGPPVYRRWVPARSALPYDPVGAVDESGDHTNVLHVTPGNLGEDAFGADFTLWADIATNRLDYLGVPFESIDRVVGVQGAAVAEFDVDRSLVGNTLAESGYERVGSYEGYDLFGRSDVPRVVAVGDEAVIQSESDSVEAARDRVRPVIDAGAGRVPRRHETDDRFRRMSERVGAAPSTAYGNTFLDPTDEVEVGVTEYNFDGDGAYFNHYNLYPEGTAPPVEALKTRMEEFSRPANSAAVDVQTDGRLATVEMRLDGAYMRETANEPVPQITWGAEYDRAGRTVTFVHEAGEVVDAEQLSVQEIELPFSTEHDQFAPGDTFTVDLTRDDLANPSSLSIEWESEDGDSMARVFTYTFPT